VIAIVDDDGSAREATMSLMRALRYMNRSGLEASFRKKGAKPKHREATGRANAPLG
jgi:hypothetical protein